VVFLAEVCAFSINGRFYSYRETTVSWNIVFFKQHKK